LQDRSNGHRISFRKCRTRSWILQSFRRLDADSGGAFRKVSSLTTAPSLQMRLFWQFRWANTMTVLLGAYAFAWQIYGDFSGYSCNAPRSAQLLGFTSWSTSAAYLAESLQDFWRRCTLV